MNKSKLPLDNHKNLCTATPCDACTNPNTNLLFRLDVNMRECEASIIEFDRENNTIILDKTIFFPEGGGQSSDIGYLYKLGNTGIPAVKVIDVKENGEFPLHRIAATDEQGELPEFTKGERLLLKIDWAHRFDNMQRHCGEHILSGIIYREIRGVNRGFHMGSDYMTIDISMEENPDLKEISSELLAKIEYEANKVIWRNLPVITRHFDKKDDAIKLPLRKKPDIESDIRIVSIGSFENAADCVACCGTHPESTGHVGLIKLFKIEPYKGMFRLYCEAGERAYKDYAKKHEITQGIAVDLSCGVEDLPERFGGLKQRISELNEQLLKAKRTLIDEYLKDEELQSCAHFDGNGIKIIYKSYPTLGDKEILRIGGALNLADNVIFAATGEDGQTLFVFSNGEKLNCGELIKNNAGIYDGKGGGRADNARVRFAKKDSIPLFLDMLEKHLR